MLSAPLLVSPEGSLVLEKPAHTAALQSLDCVIRSPLRLAVDPRRVNIDKQPRQETRPAEFLVGLGAEVSWTAGLGTVNQSGLHVQKQQHK